MIPTDTSSCSCCGGDTIWPINCDECYRLWGEWKLAHGSRSSLKEYCAFVVDYCKVRGVPVPAWLGEALATGGDK